MSDTVTVTAHAKVNLFLRVLATETDGYHGIETVFCRIGLADTLTATRRDDNQVTLEVDGRYPTGPTEANLAVRATHAVLERLRHRFGVHLTLSKRIPVGAGLGGGSSDAAAALAAVNQLAGGAIPEFELYHLGSRLGADVPFLLSSAPLALAWSHGERLLRLPGLPPAPVLLVTPAVPVRSAEAYQWIDQARTNPVQRGALALDLAALSSWSDLGRMSGNDFESVVFGREPSIREAFEAVARTRPLLCRMSGSGSTVFGVYRTERDRDDARMMLGKRLGETTATTTL